MATDEERIWKEALIRLRELDSQWPPTEEALLACRDWIASQPLPRLSSLAGQIHPGLSRQQFWCALVPVERSVSRCKITDIDILDSDLPHEDNAFPRDPMPVTILLDSLRSAFNVGSIFRTAECFGIESVVLCGYTPTPDQPQVAKSAMGMEKIVPWRPATDLLQEIHHLQAEGWHCYALETVSTADDLEEARLSFPCALVLGNERFGLSAEVVQTCDGAVRIPLHGVKNSLNVGCAFAIAAQTLRRKFQEVLR